MYIVIREMNFEPKKTSNVRIT